MFDWEVLRNEQLIEERISYENAFISLEDIMKIEEFYYYADFEYGECHSETFDDYSTLYEECAGDFDLEFDFKDCCDQLRDERLIREYNPNEANHFAFVDLDLVENDIFDFQIRAMEEEGFIEEDEYDYDFKYVPEDYEDYVYDEYEEEMFWNLHYLKISQFEAPKCGCGYLDYMPNDDGLCDYLDCYDYPEGPNENLCGVKYY